MSPAPTFLSAEVRDLAWSLASPPLLSRRDPGVHWPARAWFSQVARRFQPRLSALDKSPAALLNLLAAQRDRRLGRYFETLLAYWLRHDDRYRLLHANLALHDGGRTLGEFDFIVEDRERGKTLHWEVAVKFYLGVGDTRRPENWWGPGRRDRLDLKTAHMLDRQSRLAAHPRARAWLAEKRLHIDEHWLIMKGRLFYPYGGDLPSPDTADPSHLRGFWLHGAGLGALPETRWQVLEKNRWLAPLGDASTALDTAALIDWWQHHANRPQCIAAIDNGMETARGFIVPDTWGKD